MGKLILVSGENNSGKSVFAEKLISECEGKRYYIATMLPKTQENYDRIEKHKKQREKLMFVTLELPYSLSEAAVESESIVLLEDVSNLLANNIFENRKDTDEILKDILCLSKRCRVLVAVTISGLSGDGYDEETAMYINSLNEINQRLYNEAEAAVMMKNGKAVFEKGESYDIN